MKYRIAMLCLSLMVFHTQMNAQVRVVNSEINKVTVFYQGAQIERTTSDISLSAGQSIVVIQGLESSLLENSLRVGLKGSAKILNVVKSTDFLAQKESSVKIEKLLVEQRNLQEKIEDARMKVKVYEQERNVLITNMKFGGSNTGVNVSQIKEGADYYRSRLMEIEKTMLDTERGIKIIEAKNRLIKSQLSALNYKKNRPTSRVAVTLELDKAASCGLMLDYIVGEASWAPSYDIRIDKVGDPVQMVRKATVLQNTGEDWERVALTFSTGNPMEQQVMPVLTPWSLDFVYAQQPIRIRGMASKSAKPRVASPESMVYEVAMMDEAAYEMEDVSAGFDKGSKNSILEFALTTTADINSDGKEYVFALGGESLDAAYHYQTVPKKEKTAFLVATMTDWSGYELVDGSANIYYEKMFVGETYLSTNMTMDSLALSMGKDKGLIIDRKVLRDFTRSRTIGANVKKSFAYEIVVRNTKSVAVELIVEDQIPISWNSQISVEDDELSGGDLEEVTGKVSWKLTLQPGETKTIPLKYSVKYPKEQQVNL